MCDNKHIEKNHEGAYGIFGTSMTDTKVKNRRLRDDDRIYSAEMGSTNCEVDVRRFNKLFPDEKSCETRLNEYLGWREKKDDIAGSGIVLQFDCSKSFNTDCSSKEAFKVGRPQGYRLKTSVAGGPQFGTTTRWFYQCRQCKKQFTLYSGWIFANRKGADLWVWFLSLYAMFLLDGKIPRSWLCQKYEAYLLAEVYVTASGEVQSWAFRRTVAERIRRITKKIQDELFNEKTKTSEFLRYRELLGFGQTSFYNTFPEWVQAHSTNKKTWKIALRSRDYTKNTKYLRAYAEVNGVDKVFMVQDLEDTKSCEPGDWILCIKSKSDHKRGYLFRWLHVDGILELDSTKADSRWQAVQAAKVPVYHERPFIIDKAFNDVFASGIKEYNAQGDRELPFNKVIECPTFIFDYLSSKLMPPED
jgi:hypothetical protein